MGDISREWVSVLKVITRPPGRPKTLVNSEGFFRPFYSVATSGTSLDRTLLNLVRRPEHFASVVDRSCTPAQAAVNAGLRKPADGKGNGRVCDFGLWQVCPNLHKASCFGDCSARSAATRSAL